jgi:hypothetical protein
MFRGTPLVVGKAGSRDINFIEHRGASSGTGYLAICQLSCVEQKCDFFAYSDRFCVIMNRVNGDINQGTDPRGLAGTADRPVHSVMINMAKWTDWDACKCCAGSLIAPTCINLCGWL